MRYFRYALTMMIFALSISGCMTAKSYVDPSLTTITFSDLQENNNPKPIRLSVEFLSNGDFNPKATEELTQKAVWVLRDSGLFASIVTNDSGDMQHLNIIMNNITDVDKAKRNGLGTGLTFGAAGSFITDNYIFTATYEVVGESPIKKTYHHAIHTTIGNKKGPEGVEPMSTQQAFYEVVEQLILNFLKEMQNKGYFL